jgi:capsular polysaccharide biosynthesis protein
MNEEPLDLRRFARAVSARKWVLVAAVVIGVAGGIVFAALQTPRYASSAVVLLPPAGVDASGQPARDVNTQEQLASSDVVLSIASRNLRPPLPTLTLQQRLVVTAPTNDILVFEGHADTADQAISIANAVAEAYREYSTGNNAFLQGGTASQPAASPANAAIQVISPATTAQTSRTKSFVTRVLAGALGGLLLGIGIVLYRDARDRRLRSRNDIAAAVGCPVVATVATTTPRKPSEWLALLEGYRPRPDERWSLRRLLRDLLHATRAETAHVVIVTLRQDVPALAFAPQFAAFAAASGVTTRLVLHGQGLELAALRQAREIANTSHALDRANLSIADTAGNGHADEAPELIVSMLVVDPSAVTIDGSVESTALLAVTAGTAARDEIVAVASAAAGGDSPLAGVIVVNGEAADTDEDVDMLLSPPRAAPATRNGNRAAGVRGGSVS